MRARGRGHDEFPPTTAHGRIPHPRARDRARGIRRVPGQAHPAAHARQRGRRRGGPVRGANLANRRGRVRAVELAEGRVDLRGVRGRAAG